MRLRSLRAKLIAGLIVIGALSAVINSLAQIKLDSNKLQQQIDTELTIVEQYWLERIQSAVQQEKTNPLRYALEGIIQLPHLQRAELKVNGNPIYTAGPADTPLNNHHRTFIFTGNNQKYQLVVTAFLDAAERGLYRRTILVFLGNALRTLITILFVVLFVDHLLMRHLRRVTSYLRDTKLTAIEPPLQLEREEKNHQDELDELVKTVNQLKLNLNIYEARSRRDKEQYVALVENNPEAIWRCEIDPPLPQNLPIEQQVKHITRHTRLVELNSSAEKYQIKTAEHDSEINQLQFFCDYMWRAILQNGGSITGYISQHESEQQEHKYFSNSVVLVQEDGHYHTVWGITADITASTEAQKALLQREQELKTSKQRLAEAQSLAHMGNWDYRTENDSLKVSEEYLRIYGFSVHDPAPTKREIFQRIHPDDIEMVLEGLTSTERETVSAEHRVVWPDGQMRYVQAMASKQIENNTVTATYGILLDITEQRRAEQAREASQKELIESEARMAKAQALANMGHWILDYTTNTFSCSDEFCRLYGHHPETFDRNLDVIRRQIHPEDLAQLRERFEQVREQPASGTFRIVRPDGEIRYIRSKTIPFDPQPQGFERVFGISIDVTELIVAESALKATQELMTTAFIASPDGIAFVDAKQLTFITCNPMMHKLTGFNTDELADKPLSFLALRPINATQSDDEIKLFILSKKDITNQECTITNKHGETLTCFVSWRTVVLEGQVRKLVFIRDVTQLRQLEKITHQQNQQLIHADKLASLGTMVAGVAHEINNPNHIIQMNADLLSSFIEHLIKVAQTIPEQENQGMGGLPLSEITTAMPELFEAVKNSCQRIDRIIKDLKNFARPRAEAQYQPVNLTQVIKESLALLQPALEENKVKLQTDLPPLPAIMGDPQQLQQVIVNLVMNAVDAIGKRYEGCVKISAQHELGKVTCTIEDNGCGISDQHLGNIFDPFFTTKQESGGTGLGLAISFQLIREHGGSMEANSRIDVGTTISFTLPITQEH